MTELFTVALVVPLSGPSGPRTPQAITAMYHWPRTVALWDAERTLDWGGATQCYKKIPNQGKDAKGAQRACSKVSPMTNDVGNESYVRT